MGKKISSFIIALLFLTICVESWFIFDKLYKQPASQLMQSIHTEDATKLEDLARDFSRIKKQLTEVEVKLDADTISKAVQEKAYRSSVSLHVTSPISPYTNGTNWQGSGVILNKKKGYILTNQHVVDQLMGGAKCEVTFFDGTQASARVLFSASWLDVTVVQVNPKKIPEQASQSSISKRNPRVNQAIFIVNNSEGNSHAIHTGRITSLEKIIMAGSFPTRYLPQGDICYSVNTAGGSSGSAVFNTLGEVVALEHAGSSHGTFSLGCDRVYLKKIVSCLERGEIPSFKKTGAIVTLLPIADFIELANFSKEELQSFKSQLPKGTKNVLLVLETIRSTPAEKVLKPGDIIYAAEGKVLGGRLARLDILMAETIEDKISMEVYRKTDKKMELLELQVGLYQPKKIDKIVYFGGAYWFEADDVWAYNTNMDIGNLTFYKVEPGKSISTSKYFMAQRFHSIVTHLDGKPVANLKDLTQLIPQLIKNKGFSLNFVNLWKQNKIAWISYNPFDPQPFILAYNPKKFNWIQEKINI